MLFLQTAYRLIIALCVSTALSTAAYAHAAATASYAGITPILKQVTPAIVNITTTKEINQQNKKNSNPAKKSSAKIDFGVGSGIIIDAKQGMIITNAHVINKAESILITLKDKRHFYAKVISKSDAFDIALVQIHAPNLTALTFADSSHLEPGTFVIAIGSPFGLSQTVTSGVVSALHRSIPHLEGYQNFIQTDAPINPGNSGGALLTLQGQLVGMNTALIGPGSNAGIGFAIPSNMLSNIAHQLMEYGDVQRGLLGVIAENLNPALIQAMHLNTTQGALIAEVVPDSAAAKAGLQAKDILLKINDTPIDSAAQVRNQIAMIRPKTTVSLTLLRHNQRIIKKATLGSTKDIAQPKSNVFLTGVSAEDFNKLEGDGRTLSGALITDLKQKSQADLAGLLPGDVIINVNNHPINTLNDLITTANQRVDSLLVKIDRDQHNLFVVIEKPGS